MASQPTGALHHHGDQYQLITAAKVPKLTYKQIRNYLRERGNLYYADDNDLKQLSQEQVFELIQWFLREAFEFDAPSLLDNYDQAYFSAVPSFERLDQTLMVTNANLLFLNGLSRLNQHLSYEFEMLLKPDKYPLEWKIIITLLIDFLRTKDQMEEKHQELIQLLNNNNIQLSEATQDLHDQINAKQEIDKKKMTAFEQESELSQQISELSSQQEQAQTLLTQKTERDNELKVMQDELEEQLNELREQSKHAQLKKEDAKSMVVQSPDRLATERDLAKEELGILQDQLKLRQTNLAQLQQKWDQRKDSKSTVQEILSVLKSGSHLKEMVQQLKKQIKKEQSKVNELKSSTETQEQEVDRLKSEQRSRDQKEKQYQDYYYKLNEELQTQMNNDKLDKLERVQTLDQLTYDSTQSRDRNELLRKEIQKQLRVQNEQIREGLRSMNLLDQQVSLYSDDIRQSILSLPELN